MSEFIRKPKAHWEKREKFVEGLKDENAPTIEQLAERAGVKQEKVVKYIGEIKKLARTNNEAKELLENYKKYQHEKALDALIDIITDSPGISKRDIVEDMKTIDERMKKMKDYQMLNHVQEMLKELKERKEEMNIDEILDKHYMERELRNRKCRLV